MPDDLHVFAAGDAATGQIGTLIASALQPGDLVVLDGSLGVGKTALARAVIRGLTGDPELVVPSPTFLLVQPYAVDETPIIHADLYRLADAADLEELGLFEDERAIVLVEWPERAPELTERADMSIKIAIPAGGEGRSFILSTPCDPRRLSKLGNVLKAFAA